MATRALPSDQQQVVDDIYLNLKREAKTAKIHLGAYIKQITKNIYTMANCYTIWLSFD
jgi:hypothetical protein